MMKRKKLRKGLARELQKIYQRNKDEAREKRERSNAKNRKRNSRR